MSALFSESGSLRGILDASARALERIYRDSGEPAATQSRTTRWLAADRWFIQAQIEELDAVLSKEFCRKLNRTRLPLAGPQPRVYRTIAETLGCLVSSPLGPQALGKLLTTPALAELFAPQRLGSSLTLAELWAVPPVVKLVLIESIARSVTDWPLDSERCECEVRSAMECLHSLTRIRWSSLIESISLVHHILSQDPYGVYLKMEFDSRDLYRHAVENLASESGKSEEYIAKWAVALAWEASREEGRERECDAGYYLIGPGIRQLRRRAGLGTSFGNRLRQLALAAPNVTYAGGIAVLTALFTLA